MKKLIIAAALAVVAGGAFALDGYNFTATLKTTKGKESATPQKIYLGIDDFGNFWYDDTSITNLSTHVGGVQTNLDIKAAGYAWGFLSSTTNTTDTKVIKGKNIPRSVKLVDKNGKVLPTGAGYIATPADDPNYEAVKDLILALSGRYNKKSAGEWCEVVLVSGCYRVAGSAKINVALYTTNCCEYITTGWSYTNFYPSVTTKSHNFIVNQAINGWGNETMPVTNMPFYAELGINFLNRFGSLTSAKANKVEMYGWAMVPTTADGRWFDGDLAGQGTWSNGRVAAISGNIVGQMDPALCTYCCTLPDLAVAFECDSVVADGALFAAAYGTFRFKYNSKLK